MCDPSSFYVQTLVLLRVSYHSAYKINCSHVENLKWFINDTFSILDPALLTRLKHYLLALMFFFWLAFWPELTP